MDIKANAILTLEGACQIFSQDLEALPEEAYTQNFGPGTRTVVDVVYEVCLVNEHIDMVIRGEDPFEWPEGGFVTAPADFNTKAIAQAAFDKSAKQILSTVRALSEEELGGTVETEHGPSTRFARFQFMALHMWYHSGQLNFIQTLRGDDQWHWS